jgi:hypothetical protein
MPPHVPASHRDRQAQPTGRGAPAQRVGDGGVADDDPPAVIPHGFEAYSWDGQPLDCFLLWTKVNRHPKWHRGQVKGLLPAGRPDGFTHDVVFTGERHRRGTTLTEAAVADGVLVLIRPIPMANAAAAPAASASASAAPAPARAAATAPAPAARVRGGTRFTPAIPVGDVPTRGKRRASVVPSSSDDEKEGEEGRGGGGEEGRGPSTPPQVERPAAAADVGRARRARTTVDYRA